MTVSEAKAQGFIIDSHCSPWVGYKGPRFNPTEWHRLVMPDEEALKVATDFIRWLMAKGIIMSSPSSISQETLNKVEKILENV